MKLALFVGYLGDGGAERQLAMLARGLVRRGHRVTLFTLFPGGRHWSRLEAEGAVTLEALFDRRGGSPLHALAQRLRAPGRLRRHLEAGAFELVYSFLYVGNLLAFWSTQRGERPPLVWGLRASDVRLGLKEKPFFRLGAWASRRLSLVITNSHAGLAVHRQRGFAPRSWAVVPNGIDIARFCPAEGQASGAEAAEAPSEITSEVAPEVPVDVAALRRQLLEEAGAEEDEVLLGVVARLHPMKDHANLFDALSALPRCPPCVLVGNGAPSMRRHLEALAEARGLSHRLVWRQQVDEIPTLYRALDLLCLPSAYGEGFPNVLGEAMACGVPCVTTEVGDAARVVGDTGWTVPPSRPDALATALEEALALGRQGLRQRGVEGRLRVEERFTEEAAVEATEALLEGELLVRRQASTAGVDR
ncbi:MAG: glycosyltransferase [Acidobacteriota bacterium]